jgi:hypothetical protein
MIERHGKGVILNKKTVFCFVLVLVLAAVSAYTQQYDSENDFHTELSTNGKSVRIIRYLGNKQNVHIPPEIEGLPVISIWEYAFANHTNLKGVTIPNSITSIGYGAFFGCTSLTVITIPDSIIRILPSAFGRCSSLTAINVDVNNLSYTSKDGVLYSINKTRLIKYPAGKTAVSFIIPDGVNRIDSDAFYECISLTSVTIPNSITSIGEGAFFNCTSLTSITIPNSVTTISDLAFAGCTSLSRVMFQGTIDSRLFSMSAFPGRLYVMFYLTNKDNGTPGTYTTTAPVVWNSMWTR